MVFGDVLPNGLLALSRELVALIRGVVLPRG